MASPLRLLPAERLGVKKKIERKGERVWPLYQSSCLAEHKKPALVGGRVMHHFIAGLPHFVRRGIL